ncbi:prepilin peptidase [Microgenomates group bacterium]|nr:prepilin peptidase [Microgenomates group bacterium]
MIWVEIICYALLVGMIFFLGACWGSFLNVLLYRQKRKEDWIWKRSCCEKCGYKLEWYDNIPLFSWFLLQGKCRKCGQKIDIIHPIMEAMMGCLFLWWWVMGSWFFRLTQQPLVMLQPAFWLVTGVCLVLIFLIDLRNKIIPNMINAFLACWILGYHLLLCAAGAMRWVDLGGGLLTGMGAGVVFFGVHLLGRRIYKKEAFGLGDVKLMMVMGLLLGYRKMVAALFVAFALGSLVGVILLLTQKSDRKTAIPFGPFLVVGTLVALICGEALFRFLFVF